MASYREPFVASGPLMWTSYNEHTQGNISCPRALGFSRFAEASHYVSTRAQTSEYQPSGACPISSTSPSLEKDYSLVEENTLTYVLKSLCLNLHHTSMLVNREEVRMRLVKNSQKLSDLMNLVYLFLLNPVYIEIEDSIPYVVDKVDPSSNMLSNYIGYGLVPGERPHAMNSSIDFVLKRLLPTGKVSQDMAFSTNTKQVATARRNQANLRIYYLDTADATGRRIEFKNTELVDTLTIFDKNYASTIANKTSNEYYFNQRIYMLLTNSKFPVFNIKFDLHLNQQTHAPLITGKKATLELLKIYMDHPEYVYSSTCPFQPLGGPKNNSIVSVVVEGNSNAPKAYKLSFVTGKNKNDCGYAANNDLEIELPYVANTERITIILTVTPYNKMVLAQWVEEGTSFFKFKRNEKCDTQNNFATLFNQDKTKAPVKVHNILAKYDQEYVRKVHYVHIGHMNYVNEVSL